MQSNQVFTAGLLIGAAIIIDGRADRRSETERIEGCIASIMEQVTEHSSIEPGSYTHSKLTVKAIQACHGSNGID